MSSPVRIATAGVLAFRIAYGVGLIAAPRKLAGGKWLGDAVDRTGAQVPLRALGAREAGIHGAALAALFSGRPVRPMLLVSIAGDLSDIVATTAARRDLPEGSPAATAVVAGGSLALTAGLAALVEE